VAAGAKRRRNGAANGSPPASGTANAWKPPSGSWEDEIETIDACEDEESGKLIVYLNWKAGHKTKHTTDVIYKRCPQKVSRVGSIFLGISVLTFLCLDASVLREAYPDHQERPGRVGPLLTPRMEYGVSWPTRRCREACLWGCYPRGPCNHHVTGKDSLSVPWGDLTPGRWDI
jgi:chromo shadow domain-containing protein